MMGTSQRSSAIAVKRNRGVFAPRDVPFGTRGSTQRLVDIAARVALLALVVTNTFGTLGAALFVVASAAMIGLAPQTAMRDLGRFWPLLLLAIFALASTMWSDAPERSLRAALQLFMTCVAGILICRRIGASSMILLLFFSYLVVCLILSIGAPQAMATHSALFSPLIGSKNQVGFAAHMLIALALTVAVDRRHRMAVRLSTIPAILLGLLILVLAQSAGAQTSLAITLVTFPAFMIFGRVSISMRILVLGLALVVTAIALVFLPDILAAWADFRTTVLKKDATLTGRTYLWDVAARLNAERPWLGRGYYAFWRQGNIDAEGLWRWGGIPNRSGFNFHNAYIEMQVDLGWLGAGLFLLMCAGIAIVGFARQLLRPSAASAFLLSFMIVLYLRGYAESGLIAPFSLLTLLWLATAVNAMDGLSPQKTAASGGTERTPLRQARRGAPSERSAARAARGR